MPWIRRAELEALSAAARAAELARLRAQIDDRLAGRSNWRDFWRETEAIVAELRTADHDLWSHDYDGESRHLWGWNYMRPEQAGRLQIQVNFGAPCQTFWRGEDGRLATERRDD
jgi:hypothetical protein